MIPKRIFYCWFGKGDKSELNKRCIESWYKFCPDYEIIEINETNYDYQKDDFAREAYERKNWSFVSDKARIETLRDNAGFYLDTDIELFKSLDTLTKEPAILGETGFGFYGSMVMGRGDVFPEVYSYVLKKLGRNSLPIHILINNYLYDNYEVTGEDIMRFPDISVFSTRYIADTRTPVTEDTIMKHWEENTWTKGWTGGFKPGSDFYPCKIYVNGERVSEYEKKWYGKSEDFDVILECSQEPDLEIVEKANLLRNARVTGVCGDR